jgi:hypothetical protein
MYLSKNVEQKGTVTQMVAAPPYADVIGDLPPNLLPWAFVCYGIIHLATNSPEF